MPHTLYHQKSSAYAVLFSALPSYFSSNSHLAIKCQCKSHLLRKVFLNSQHKLGLRASATFFILLGNYIFILCLFNTWLPTILRSRKLFGWVGNSSIPRVHPSPIIAPGTQQRIRKYLLNEYMAYKSRNHVFFLQSASYLIYTKQ